MSILKITLVAASFVVVAAAANAQGREDLNSGFHGASPAVRSYNIAPRGAFAQDARGAFAQSRAVRVRPQSQVQQQEANPLFDNFHGD